MKLLLTILAGATVASCTLDSTDPMRVQPKYHAYSESKLFEDHRAMRVPVPDTYPREHGLAEQRLPLGGDVDAGFAPTMPIALSRELIDEGHQAFDIYCATCHGLLADGDSPPAKKMALRPPPALVGVAHQPDHPPSAPASSELPHPPGFYVSVMTNGYGLMPSYASALTPHQRWAVVAYLRVLAHSQNAPLRSAPADVQTALLREAP